MRKIISFPPFFYLLLFSFSYSYSQSEGDSLELYRWFDASIGIENTRLFNGKEYIEKHRTINAKNKYYTANEVLTGAVLYDGQWFGQLNMKYNIYDDLLLVQMEAKSGTTILQLINEQIEKFRLNGQVFLNIPANAAIKGFHEVLWEDSNYGIYKKHARKVIEKRNRAVAYYEFEEIRGPYAFKYLNSYHTLSSKTDLFPVFPEDKDFINQYFRSHSRLANRQPDVFYVNLFKELSSRSKNSFTPAQ